MGWMPQLHASAEQIRSVPVRNWDKAELVLQTFEDLGFSVPTGMKVAAAANSPLGPYKFDLWDLDRALSKTTLKVHQKIGIKTAADRFGLLKKVAR